MLDYLRNPELSGNSLQAHASYAKVYSVPNPGLDRFNKVLHDIVHIGICLHYITDTLFPKISKGCKGVANVSAIPSSEMIEVLRKNNTVQESLLLPLLLLS